MAACVYFRGGPGLCHNSQYFTSQVVEKLFKVGRRRKGNSRNRYDFALARKKTFLLSFLFLKWKLYVACPTASHPDWPFNILRSRQKWNLFIKETKWNFRRVNVFHITHLISLNSWGLKGKLSDYSIVGNSTVHCSLLPLFYLIRTISKNWENRLRFLFFVHWLCITCTAIKWAHRTVWIFHTCLNLISILLLK